MFKKMGLMVSVCALVFGFGASHVFASGGDKELCLFQAEAEEEGEEEEAAEVPGYCDGRINTFDIAQPVAIYYTYETVQRLDDHGNAYLTDVVSGIELWAIDEESNGHLVLRVPLADLEEAFEADSDVEIASAEGITLSYSPSTEEFTVTAPGYSFSWEPWNA